MATDRRGPARLVTCRLVLLSAVTLAVAAPRSAQAQMQMPHMPGDEMSWGTASLVLVDQAEFAPSVDGRPLRLDMTGWFGGAYQRLWIQAEGEQPTKGGRGGGDLAVFYGRLISPYWDAVAGIRVDGHWGEGGVARASLAFGLIGLAPLRFELTPTLYVSQDGDVSARLEAEYQILVTQRLVLEPELELNASVQEVPRFEVRRGLNDLALSLRLRYEITRELAPYVGFSWRRRWSGHTVAAREEDAASDMTVVVGLRMWR